MGKELLDVHRCAQALALIREFFPDYDVSDISIGGGDHWFAILCRFFNMVEQAGWFDIDWSHLNYLEEWWMQTDDEESDWDSGSPATELAQFLALIPVKVFGHDEEELMNNVAENQPWLTVMAGLLGQKDVELNESWGDDLGIDFPFWALNADIVRDRIEQHDFSLYPEPLCWLPEMVKIAGGCTGNDLLDGIRSSWDWTCPDWRRDSDVEYLKELWAKTKPAIDRWEKFCEWMDAHPARIQEMLDVLLGLEDEEEDTDDDE